MGPKISVKRLSITNISQNAFNGLKFSLEINLTAFLNEKLAKKTSRAFVFAHLYLWGKVGVHRFFWPGDFLKSMSPRHLSGLIISTLMMLNYWARPRPTNLVNYHRTQNIWKDSNLQIPKGLNNYWFTFLESLAKNHLRSRAWK